MALVVKAWRADEARADAVLLRVACKQLAGAAARLSEGALPLSAAHVGLLKQTLDRVEAAVGACRRASRAAGYVACGRPLRAAVECLLHRRPEEDCMAAPQCETVTKVGWFLVQSETGWCLLG